MIYICLNQDFLLYCTIRKKYNNNMPKELLIIRGVPGSGKTTLAKLFTSNICEADMFFEQSGIYEWKREELSSAHSWCFARAEMLMKKEKKKIAVSNTFTKEKEMKPYIDLAKLYGYDVHIIVKENRHDGLNIHEVPTETIDKMKKNLANSIRL